MYLGVASFYPSGLLVASGDSPEHVCEAEGFLSRARLLYHQMEAPHFRAQRPMNPGTLPALLPEGSLLQALYNQP